MIDQTLEKSINDFLKDAKNSGLPPLLVVLGPTASGKTALSIELAKKYGGEIISADSRQVYRHMDIGTDKIAVDKREGVPHWLIDVVEPSERFTVADFKKLAEKKIDEIFARGNLPMLVGGTGLYIRAITQNFKIPDQDLGVREKLMKELEEEGGKEKLYERLCKLDPESSKKIHKNNIPYLVRALEIVAATGAGKPNLKGEPKYKCLQTGIAWPREILFERINKRVDEQIGRGLLEETKKLLDMGLGKKLASMQSLGYKEIVQYLDGALTLEEALELLKNNTRNFAKRQMTWFKKDEGILWVNNGDGELCTF